MIVYWLGWVESWVVKLKTFIMDNALKTSNVSFEGFYIISGIFILKYLRKTVKRIQEWRESLTDKKKTPVDLWDLSLA